MGERRTLLTLQDGLSFPFTTYESLSNNPPNAAPEWVVKAGARVDLVRGRGGFAAAAVVRYEPDYEDPVFLEKLDNFFAAAAERMTTRVGYRLQLLEASLPVQVVKWALAIGEAKSLPWGDPNSWNARAAGSILLEPKGQHPYYPHFKTVVKEVKEGTLLEKNLLTHLKGKFEAGTLEGMRASKYILR